MDLTHGAENLQTMLLVFFRHFGAFGNTLFFTCSAWFLLSSNSFNKRKWFYMLFEIWFISVAVFLCTFFFIRDEISLRHIVKSFLPTYFATNSYLTLYLLFYPIHPFLNEIIRKMDQTTLFRASLSMFLLYFVFSLIGGTFFASRIIFWVTMYFVIAYCKLYLRDACDSLKTNLILFALSTLCFILLIAATNYLHTHSYLSGKMLHWAVNNNPLLFAMSFSLLQIARQFKFKNTVINYLSGLSMLIYILHENVIFRNYYRPQILNAIHARLGQHSIPSQVLITAVLIFAGSLLLSAVYHEVLQKHIRTASSRIFDRIKTLYMRMENKIVHL